MAHYVTCVYCKQKYDRDKVPTIQISPRRYAHTECAKQHEELKSQEEKDLEDLELYIKTNILHENFINPKVKKQIKDYHTIYGYSYSGMHKALKWFYEIKGNSLDKANGGIGIVPYVYKDAYDYYYKMFLAQKANENKDLEQYHNNQIKIIQITSPTAYIKPHRLFNLDAEEDNVDV